MIWQKSVFSLGIAVLLMFIGTANYQSHVTERYRFAVWFILAVPFAGFTALSGSGFMRLLAILLALSSFALAVFLEPTYVRY